MHSKCCSEVKHIVTLNINSVSLLRFIAIILVIMCHTCHLVTDRSYSAYSEMMSWLLGSIGTFGVPIFYYISGFFFQRSNKSFGAFFKSKVFSIIIPWIFTATLVYMWGVIRKGGFDAWTLCKEVLGIGSYTWYLTVLILLYLICWLLKSRKIPIIVVFVFSILLTTIETISIHLGLLPISQLTYFVIFRWIPYFTMGMLGAIKHNEKIDPKKHKANFKIFLSISLVVILLLRFVLGGRLYYWSCSYLFLSIIVILYLLFMTRSVNVSKNGFIGKAERYSFSIYLLHMPIAGIIANVFNRLYLSPMLIRPVLVFFFTYFAIILLQKVFDLIKIKRFCNYSEPPLEVKSFL